MLLVNFSLRSLLLRSSRLFAERMNQSLQKFDLNYSLWVVLHVIHDAKQCSLIEIAKELDISQPAVTKRIFELEQKQLIQFVSTENRREKIVRLNALGLDLYLHGQRFLDELEKSYCQEISKEDFETTQKVLRLFLNNLQEKGDDHGNH